MAGAKARSVTNLKEFHYSMPSLWAPFGFALLLAWPVYSFQNGHPKQN
jgi:hypothetical protein